MRKDLVEKTRADIAGRLKRVCSNLRDEEFAALVARIAEIEIKYSIRRQDSFFATNSER